MLIDKRRIRDARKYVTPFSKGQKLRIACSLLDTDAAVLPAIGFPPSPQLGDRVLPATVGPVSMYNAEGKWLVHKDRPKETAYRQVEWHWEEWHGPYREPNSRIVDVPYKRYPRELMPPPGCELQMAERTDGVPVVASDPIAAGDENLALIEHVINLFLELFGRCEVLPESLTPSTPTQVRRLNWEVLPPGKHLWGQLKPRLDPIIGRAPEGNQPVIRHRLGFINQHGPEFCAVGRAGFQGYIVFGFPPRRIYLLESMYYGNATYVFGDDWETLSQLTKAEVIAGSLQKARIIHRKRWDKEVGELLRRATT